MKKYIASLIISFAALTTITASAGTQALGFEVGVSTLDQVKGKLTKQTKVVDAGLNKYSSGPMLKTDGSAYEIDGLNNVLYIFDEQQKLAGIIMYMNKARFDVVFETLAAKYKVVAKQRPFVGNQYGLFKTPDSTVQLDAPHLGFDMEVRYVRNDLWKQFHAVSAEEDVAKKKNEAAKF